MSRIPASGLRPGPENAEAATFGRRRPVLTLFVGLFACLALIGVAGLIAVHWADRQFEAAGPLRETKDVQIPRGLGTDAIAVILHREGVISNAFLFRVGVLARRAQSRLKAGEYRFEPNVSMAGVLDTLLRGRAVSHRITIPEGLTSRQIVERVMAQTTLAGEILDTPPEGSLLPQTYDFRRGEDRNGIIERMRAAQKAVVEKHWANRAEGLPVKTPEEALILASIVEKETGVASERRRVAAVFVNRLKRGIRLQSDPTIIYGIVGGKGRLGRPILQTEIDRKTPYNTYRIDGLPPTPIANPGEAAIEAVLNPARSDELYFVADGSGGHAFSKTLEEHNVKVRAWRKIVRERRDAAKKRAVSAPAPASRIAESSTGPDAVPSAGATVAPAASLAPTLVPADDAIPTRAGDAAATPPVPRNDAQAQISDDVESPIKQAARPPTDAEAGTAAHGDIPIPRPKPRREP